MMLLTRMCVWVFVHVHCVCVCIHVHVVCVYGRFFVSLDNCVCVRFLLHISSVCACVRVCVCTPSLLHMSNISRVPDQIAVSQAWYIVEIYHSGLKPSVSIYVVNCILSVRLKVYNSIWESRAFSSLREERGHGFHTHSGKGPKNPINYRPIVLGSCLCMIIEHLVNAWPLLCLESKVHSANVQCCFRKNRSTVYLVLKQFKLNIFILLWMRFEPREITAVLLCPKKNYFGMHSDVKNWFGSKLVWW